MVSDAGASHGSSRRGHRLEPEEMAELVARAQAGDEQAFEDLVTATYVETYTLARRLTGNDDDALASQTDPAAFGPLLADTPCTILYTSGTTGRPKGAVLSNLSVYARCACNALELRVQPGGRRGHGRDLTPGRR